MNNLKQRLLFLFAFFILIGCNTDDEPIPDLGPQEPAVRYIKSDEIPEIIEELNQAFHLKNDRLSSSSDLGNLTISEVDFEKVMEVIDTLENTTYSFRVDDEDEDFRTFTNLLIRKNEAGELESPYFLHYKVDTAYQDQFIESNFSMEKFTGSVSKEFVVPQVNTNSGLTANLENRMTSGTDCPPTYFDEGTNGSPDGLNGTSQTGGGTLEWQCWNVMVVSDPCELPSSWIPGTTFTDHNCVPGAEYHMTIETRCGYVQKATSNGDGCSFLDNGYVGINSPIDNSTALLFLNYLLPLNSNQVNWLSNNLDPANAYRAFLMEEGEFYEDGTLLPEFQQAVMLSIELEMNNRLLGPNDYLYGQIISNFAPSNTQTDPTQLLMYLINMELAFLMDEHRDDPEWFSNGQWNRRKLQTRAALNALQTIFDFAGAVPVVGEVFDVINGGIYLLQGDGVNAALSFSAAVPIAGWVSTGVKVARKGALRWVVKSSGLIDFGSRSKLRKILNIPVGDPRQAHHLVPWSLRNNDVVQKAASAKTPFHMNDHLNGIPVESWRNQPNHQIYNDKVKALLDNLPSNLTPQQAATELETIANRIRQAIMSSPNTHLNDLVF